jgi:dihydrofolate reductase
MRRIRYAVATSVDGFVAGPNGENDWIVIDPDLDFGAIFQSFDTLLMGRRTFEIAQTQGGAGELPGMKAVVVSHTLKQADHPDVLVIGSKLSEEIEALRSQPGKDIWLFGGPELFRRLLAANLVDSVEVTVIPVLLGAGVPLLAAPTNRAQLQLTKHTVYPKTGTVALEYDVLKGTR